MLTQTRLKELLDYDPETGGFTWLISQSQRTEAGEVAGSFCNGYLEIYIDSKRYKSHRLAWLYVYGYLPENRLDHKDQVKHHNWIGNLREASHQCNVRNTGNRSTNTSGVKGVCWDKSRSKWMATIVIDARQSNLGRHEDFLEAVCHRLAAEQFENWENCDSSTPAYRYVREHIVNPQDSAELYCDGCKWLWPSETEQNEMKEYIDHACRKYGSRVYHYGQHPRLPRLEYCKEP